jgi:phage gp46-like protein
MATDESLPRSVELLVADTRVRREVLRLLVDRMRKERSFWEQDALALTLRPRLTPTQRERFRTRLAAHAARRSAARVRPRGRALEFFGDVAGTGRSRL